jgi:prepilin-type N-terminal cleavage/methylation domain-containing protein
VKLSTRKEKGFSLIELLVVLMVISLLSGGVVIAATRTIASAKAVRVLSDLNSIRFAYIMYSVDEEDLDGVLSDITLLDPFLDSSLLNGKYSICEEEDSIYVGTGPLDKKVLLRLAKHSSESGLYSSLTAAPPITSYDSETGKWVWLKVQ